MSTSNTQFPAFSSKPLQVGLNKLVVVAHPDDETIFFGGTILSGAQHSWTVLCVTNGDSKDQRARRAQELRDACLELGVEELLQWDFPDVFSQRLDLELLITQLKQLDVYDEVYTHGIMGEYGHPHHQDVSLAVHLAFVGARPVKSVAFNCAPAEVVNLSQAQYAVKAKLITDTYALEFQRFMGLLPISFSEGFIEAGLEEIRCVYDFLVRDKKISQAEFTALAPHYAHLYDLILQGWAGHSADGFFAAYFAAEQV